MQNYHDTSCNYSDIIQPHADVKPIWPSEPSLDVVSHNIELCAGILNHLQVQQNVIRQNTEYLRNQGKKGLKFRNNPDTYPMPVTKYCDLIAERMSDKQKFNILYHLLEGDAKDVYNRHSSEHDHTIALKNVWCALRETYDYREHNPLTELNKPRARPAVDCTVRSMHTLLSDIVYCRDRAGSLLCTVP